MASVGYSLFRIREEVNDLDKIRRGKSGSGTATRTKRQLRDWIKKGKAAVKARKNKENKDVLALQIGIEIGEKVLSGELQTARALYFFAHPQEYVERGYMHEVASGDAVQKYNQTATQLLELSAAYRRAGSNLDAWYEAGLALSNLLADPDVKNWGDIGIPPEGAEDRAKFLYDQHYRRAVGYVEAWKKHPRVREENMPTATINPVAVQIMRNMTPEVRAAITDGPSGGYGYDVEYEQPSRFTLRNVAIGFGVVTGVVAVGLAIRAATR